MDQEAFIKNARRTYEAHSRQGLGNLPSRVRQSFRDDRGRLHVRYVVICDDNQQAEMVAAAMTVAEAARKVHCGVQPIDERAADHRALLTALDAWERIRGN